MFQKNTSLNIVIYCVIIILLLFGVIYFIAPLYQYICKDSEYLSAIWNFFLTFNFFKDAFNIADNLILKVVFYVNVSEDLPWKCVIDLNQGYCNIGEPILRTIRISNESNTAITAIALVDILPLELNAFLNKQQCFCFEPIRLYPWETIYLPIIFNILPDIYYNFIFNLNSTVIILYSFLRIGW